MFHAGNTQYYLQLCDVTKQLEDWILFPHNNTYLLINIVPFKVISLGLYTESPVTAPAIKAFCKVHCSKPSKCVPRLCLNNADIIESPLL